MDKDKELCDWLRKMGYDGEFPTSFKRISNPSTHFLWDQLFAHTKPIAEIENIKDNILVSRLKNNDISKIKNKYSYALEDISLYEKKLKIMEELECIKSSVAEKRIVNKQLEQQNKLKIFNIEKINLIIKEMKQKEVLLNAKNKLLEDDIKIIMDIIDSFPKKLNNKDNCKEIKEVLVEYKEHILKSLKNNPMPLKTSQNFSKIAPSSVKKKVSSILERKRSINKVCLFNEPNMNTSNLSEIEFMDLNDDENFLMDISNTPSTKFNYTNSTLIHNENNYNINQQSTELLLNKVVQNVKLDNIKELLNQYNRENIWNSMQVLEDLIYSKVINFSSATSMSKRNQGNEDWSRLYLIHIETELKTVNNNEQIMILSEKLNDKIQFINTKIFNSNYNDDTIKKLCSLLQLHIDDIAAQSIIESMKKLNSQKNEDESNFINIKKKLVDITDKLVIKRNTIFQYIDFINCILNSIKRTRRSTSSCVLRLNPYSSDLEWCSSLTKGICSEEIRLFKEFPLEYNRRCSNTKPNVYLKDLYSNQFIWNWEFVDDDLLNMLSFVVNNPYISVNQIIHDILNEKFKLGVLKSQKDLEDSQQLKTYTLEELQKKEEYIKNVINQFKNLLTPTVSREIILVGDKIKDVIDIWKNISFKGCIPSTKTVNNKNYECYERIFDSYYYK